MPKVQSAAKMEGRACESANATGLAGSSLHRNRHPLNNIIGHWDLVIPRALILGHWFLSPNRFPLIHCQ